MSDKFGMPMVDVRTNKQLIAEIKQLTEENARLRATLECISEVFNFDSSAGNMAREALKGQP